MSIASELQNYEDGLGDAYDAAQTMGAVMPAQKNMSNLDATILTIPQPTVNDGTLTIQQNGTTLGTFTANQASNTTVNITGGGGSSVTVFYGYIVAGENKHFYSDQAMTTAITVQDFQDAIDDTTQVVVIYDVDGDEQHVVVMGEGSTARVIGDFGDAVYKIQGVSTPSSTNFTITATNLQHRLTAGSNITISSDIISATDTTYSNFVGATSSVAGSAGLVPAPTTSDPDKFLRGDGTWATPSAQLVEMAYGESNAWAKFIAAYNAGAIVYCRASSNANPGTGSQTRKAFMAYVNNATAPTSVEFQYVRSQSSKTDSQQCDQVFVYTLTNASGGTWSVASRNMGPKIVAGTGMTSTFTTGANATITLNAEPDYSTSEVDTKVKWVDGKTIYRKTINFGALPNATVKSVSHGISNLNYVVKIEGTAEAPNSTWITLPVVYRNADAAYNVEVSASSTDVVCNTSQDRSMFTAYITLYYTKTA